MKRIFLVVIGGVLLLMGAVSMLTPIPGATFMLAGGMVILICASPLFRLCMQALRTRFRFFNRMMSWMEEKTGERLGGALRLTQPGRQPEPGDRCSP